MVAAASTSSSPRVAEVPRSASRAVAALSADFYLGSQRRRIWSLTVGVILASVGMATLVWLLQFVSVVVLLVWIVLIAIAWQPRTGLYVLFGLIGLFEDGSADPLMLPGAYIHGDLSQTLGLGGVIVSPVELLLLLTFSIWLGRGIAFRRLAFDRGTLGKPMLAFAFALIFGFVRGVAFGGPLNVALWESRFILYMVMCYFITTNTIRTRGHLATLTGIFVVSNLAFAIEGAYRRVALIDTGIITLPPESWYNHEDVVLLGCLVLFSLALMVFGGPRWQRCLAPFAIAIAGFTLMATERRAGLIAIIVAFLAFTVLLLGANRRAFLRVAVPILLVGAVYLPVFWNASGVLAQPARAVRSLKDPDPRDAMSNLTRDLEKINVMTTIKNNPLFGVGFGRRFEQVVSIPDISFFVFWDLEPHHGVLWVWLKTGAWGFAIFLGLMGGAIARAAACVKTLTDPLLRSTAVLAMCAVITSLTFAYVDLGLTSGRVTMFLGITLGALAILQRIKQEAPAPAIAQRIQHEPLVRALSTSRLRGT